MAEKKTLEEFIKEYVDKKIADGEIKSVGDYAISKLSRPDERSAADGKLFASLASGAEYGRSGERLSSLGLSDSGYARYLSEISKKQKAELLKKKTAGYDRTDSGYAEYLKNNPDGSPDDFIDGIDPDLIPGLGDSVDGDQQPEPDGENE